MFSKIKSDGFSAIELILIVVVVGIIGFAGYTVMKRNSKSEDSNVAESTQQEAPIENAQDLQQAKSDLDGINVDQLDTTELDQAEADLL